MRVNDIFCVEVTGESDLKELMKAGEKIMVKDVNKY